MDRRWIEDQKEGRYKRDNEETPEHLSTHDICYILSRSHVQTSSADT